MNELLNIIRTRVPAETIKSNFIIAAVCSIAIGIIFGSTVFTSIVSFAISAAVLTAVDYFVFPETESNSDDD